MTPSELTAITLTLIASITDIKTKKVPNWLTFPGALLGLVLQWQSYQLVGVIYGILGWLLAVALMLTPRILLVLFRRSSSPVGYGDIKLLAAVGACLGPNKLFCSFFFFCIVFGSFSLWKIARALPWNKLRDLTPAGTSAISFLTPEDKLHISTTMQTPIPIAPVIALSTICGIYLYSPVVHLLGLVF